MHVGLVAGGLTCFILEYYIFNKRGDYYIEWIANNHVSLFFLSPGRWSESGC